MSNEVSEVYRLSRDHYSNPITWLVRSDDLVEFRLHKADGYMQTLAPCTQPQAQRVIELIQWMDRRYLSAGVFPMLLKMFAPRTAPLDRHLCSDCGRDTSSRIAGAWEYYIVNDEVWKHAIWNELGTFSHTKVVMLCIGCLEDRMGRNLHPADFLFCPVNTDPLRPRSGRLRDRMGLGMLWSAGTTSDDD